MKVIRRELQFEGTPEEFEASAHLFGASPSGIQEPTGSAEGMDPVTAIQRMLTRIEIPRGQRDLYLALADGPVEYEDLLKKVGRSVGEFSGVIGALGHRVNGTKEIKEAGLPENSTAVLARTKVNGKRYFALTPDALQALKAEGVL